MLAVIFIRPEELPGFFRKFGALVRQMKETRDEFLRGLADDEEKGSEEPAPRHSPDKASPSQDAALPPPEAARRLPGQEAAPSPPAAPSPLVPPPLARLETPESNKV